MVFAGILLASSLMPRLPIDRSILEGQPCQVPCWQNITPGKTSSKEAIEVLNNSLFINKESIQKNGDDEYGGVIWDWIAPTKRITSRLYWRNNIVEEITISLTFDLTLENFLNKFGNPEGIIIGEGGHVEYWYWIIDLYYPKLGMIATAYTKDYSDIIEQSTSVDVFTLSNAMTIEEMIAMRFGPNEGSVQRQIKLLRPWNGYGDIFQKYYDSRAEISP